MDDLISRQAAIMHFVKASKNYECGMFELKELTHELWQIPSAQPKNGKWIPCREKLPEYGKTVLITNAKGNVSYGRFRGVEFWKEDGDSCWTWKKNTIEHVLAWMPLPEPYKEE